MVGEWSRTSVLQIQLARMQLDPGLNPVQDYDMGARLKRLRYQTKWRYVSKNFTLKKVLLCSLDNIKSNLKRQIKYVPL